MAAIKKMTVELTDDLNTARPNAFSEVVFESARKTFRTTKEGVVFEFPLKQPEGGFWNGTKIYGSGRTSKIRFKRVQVQAPSRPLRKPRKK